MLLCVIEHFRVATDFIGLLFELTLNGVCASALHEKRTFVSMCILIEVYLQRKPPIHLWQNNLNHRCNRYNHFLVLAYSHRSSELLPT